MHALVENTCWASEKDDVHENKVDDVNTNQQDAWYGCK